MLKLGYDRPGDPSGNTRQDHFYLSAYLKDDMESVLGYGTQTLKLAPGFEGKRVANRLRPYNLVSLQRSRHRLPLGILVKLVFSLG